MNIEVSDEVRTRLQQAMSDNEACAILVEAGVDVEAIERELADEQLENVAGGWEGIDREYECPWCHEKDREMVSRQFWASLFIDSGSKWRCRKCEKYFYIRNGLPSKY